MTIRDHGSDLRETHDNLVVIQAWYVGIERLHGLLKLRLRHRVEERLVLLGHLLREIMQILAPLLRREMWYGALSECRQETMKG